MAYKLETVSCVDASNVFDNEQMELLSDSDPDFTWGDNNRSLVMAERIKRHLEEFDENWDGVEDMIEACNEVMAEHGPLVYIDLEH